GDVLCDFDLTAEIAQHEKSGARATLALVPVEDPTAYGVVLTDSENRVEAFLEKPDAADAPADPRINAGCYVLEREVLGSIVKGQNCSFEHDVFPQMVGKGLHAFQADGYWIDLGTPERYMQATDDLLDNKVESWVSERLSAGGRAIEPGVSTEGVTIHAPVVIDDGCELGAGAVIGPYAVLGHGCIVGAGTRIEHAVAQRGSTIGKNVVLDHSVVGPGVELGDEVVVGEASVIGEGARVGAGNTIKGASRIDAGVDIPASTVGV
ncbi:MAG: NDP-sugar synthase, partial [Thermoleophilaceae bacterium]|nr:NDP-sugar synthase [Thermoleophilaceae bacterium]